jgi:hypothetical protein
MRVFKKSFFLFFPFFLFLFSCNNQEGMGGSSSLEGYVYVIEHWDNNYTFQTDTFPALDAEVFLEFGDDLRVGERVRSGREGYYRFDYLRKGNYTVYALSDFGERKEPVAKKVKVSGDLNKADTIFIHSGDAVGSAMVKGSVWIKYYNDGRLIQVNEEDSIAAVEARVFIKYVGEETHFDDARVGNEGVFIFQKIRPGKRYEVYVSSEELSGEKYKNVLLPVFQEVTVEEAYKTYPLDGEAPLTFTIKMNN